MSEGLMLGLIFTIMILAVAITAALKAFFKFISGEKGGKNGRSG